MKKCWRMLVASVFLVFAMGIAVHADDAFKSMAKHVWVLESNSGEIYPEYAPAYKSASSSNSKVVSVIKGTYYGVKIKKPGTATITVKYVYGGKTKTAKIKYKIVKYKSKFSTFKIGGKNLLSAVKKGSKCSISPCSGKVTMKIKKGYKLYSADVFKSGYIGGESFPLKNGKKVKLKKGYLVMLGFGNSKGQGFTQYIYVK